MDLYLAEGFGGQGSEQSWEGLAVLMSYEYARKDKNFGKYYPTARKFLLDSGAFTFIDNAAKHKSVSREEWYRYTDELIAFINKYDIDLFFEMDIDAVVGLEFVEELRERMERGTGKKPIPVWHISRGKEYFVEMCKKYPYVAFGGLNTDGATKAQLERAFPWFIETAHKYGAKIHLLGYTSLPGIRKFRPDSADSSTWSTYSRYAHYPTFDPKTGDLKHGRLQRPGYTLHTGKKVLKIGWEIWEQISDWYRRNV